MVTMNKGSAMPTIACSENSGATNTGRAIANWMSPRNSVPWLAAISVPSNSGTITA